MCLTGINQEVQGLATFGLGGQNLVLPIFCFHIKYNYNNIIIINENIPKPFPIQSRSIDTYSKQIGKEFSNGQKMQLVDVS